MMNNRSGVRGGKIALAHAARLPRSSKGFTLVEMIIVIVITGIIGGIVAMFLRAPVQGYVDSARRAELTDIADTSLRRVARDLRLALPNSVRRTASGGSVYLEFIPTIGGGRYRAGEAGAGVAQCGSLAADVLDFTAADTCFQVLGQMPPVAIGDQIVVYNLGIPGADAYAGNTTAAHNRRAISGVGASSISLTSAAALPFDSCALDAGGFVVGGCRFQAVQTPVTYVCTPLAGGVGGTLTRWQGYAIQSAQPTALPIGGSSATLATNVSACDFTYAGNVVAERSGLVTMHLTITEQGESVALYGATHVSNVP
jgi:MSHA biogenesis protein MshO